MALNPLADYLLRLTSRKAFNLFLAAFVLGAASIYFDIGIPWVPAVVVVCYGLLLFYSAKFFLVTHSDLTNNSPYFLGFLFFLMSVFSTFHGIAGSGDNVDSARVLRQLGAALLTTIVGLPFRQLLFAYAPGQQDQDVFFRNLEEELRRSATEFRKSQSELVDLLRLFIETRKTLFAEEEAASKKYLNGLATAASTFVEFNGTYPGLIVSALRESSKAVASMRESLESLNLHVNKIDPQFLQELVTYFGHVKSSVKALEETAQSTSVALGGLGTAATAFPDKIAVVTSGMKANTDDFANELRNRLASLGEDLKAIDEVLDDFVRVTSRRVSGVQ